jgi:quercetin dioxygenase-like cupin family protein
VIGRFEDERGVIQDLFDGEPVHVTKITTRKGAVRGNHVHEQTDQLTIVLNGQLAMAEGPAVLQVDPGMMIHTPAGCPHAWKALQDTTCIVLTRGPRGRDFESDTIRLKEPLLT